MCRNSYYKYTVRAKTNLVLTWRESGNEADNDAGKVGMRGAVVRIWYGASDDSAAGVSVLV